MKTYKTIEEGLAEAKARGVKLTKSYIVNGREVAPAVFRATSKPIKAIYRSGMYLVIEK